MSLAAPPRTRRARPARVLRHVVITAAVLLVSLALGTSALVAVWLAGYRIPLASGTTWMSIVKTASADAAGGPDGHFFILLVGNDYRPEVGGARGDALHLVGVNPAQNQATMLNIPRDTCWRGGKINRAHATGGPREQATAVGEVVGVPVAYVVSVDFAGFQGLVNGVGGVTVNVPYEMSDKDSGAYFSPGPVQMDGFHALAFSRDRHDFPRGDITRSENQGYLILEALKQLQRDKGSAAGEFQLLMLLGRHAQVDGVGLQDLYRLGRVAQHLDPAAVRSVTIPVGGGSCLGLSGDAAGLFADFADDAILQTH